MEIAQKVTKQLKAKEQKMLWGMEREDKEIKRVTEKMDELEHLEY